MDLPLFLLHLRRALHPGLGLVLLGAALLVVIGAPHGAREVLRAGIDSEALARGLRRADLGFALLAVLAPVLLAGVGRVLRRVDDGERLWLLSRPVSRARIVLSTWGGATAGALLWLVLIGIGMELRAGGGAESWRPAERLEITRPERSGEEGVLSWVSESAPRAPGCRARLTTGLLGSYNEVEYFELTARDAVSGASFATGRAEPGRNTVIEVAVPPGDAPLALSLHAQGARRQMILNRPTLELYVPTSEGLGTLRLLTEVALVLAGTLALALGLGAWLSPASSLLLLIGGYVLAWLETESLDGSLLARWLPGYDLPRALALVAEGRVPAALPLEAWLGALLLVSLGLSAQRVALGRWRSGP